MLLAHPKNGNLACILGVLSEGSACAIEGENGKPTGTGETDDEGCAVFCCSAAEHLVQRQLLRDNRLS